MNLKKVKVCENIHSQYPMAFRQPAHVGPLDAPRIGGRIEDGIGCIGRDLLLPHTSHVVTASSFISVHTIHVHVGIYVNK